MDVDVKEYNERVELTHAQQVERFGWCLCDGDGHIAEGCPTKKVGV